MTCKKCVKVVKANQAKTNRYRLLFTVTLLPTIIFGGIASFTDNTLPALLAVMCGVMFLTVTIGYSVECEQCDMDLH